MKNKKYIIGADIGATFVKIGAVDKSGKVIRRSSFSTGDFPSKKEFIKALSDCISIIIKSLGVPKSRITGLGIGVPGTVDYKNGIVHGLTNIKGWKEVPLRKILQGIFKFPVCIDNDANAFAKGELTWGSARNTRNAICVTLGSGVGGGIIINGELYRGSNYAAGEIGHMCIDLKGQKCACGNTGCLETFVGNAYIVKRAVNLIKKGAKTSLKSAAAGDLSRITPQMITEAAVKNDKFSVKIWEETGVYLAIGLSGAVNMINPEKIIIAGGISKAGKFIFAPLKKELKKRAMKTHLKVLKVMRAELADDAGIIGAASLII
ncbi:MAG: ROK family protein [Candidatus Omnitrophica bacterium]|nr:ROK family protein [Candidatus Omnitrophota bacterium]